MVDGNITGAVMFPSTGSHSLRLIPKMPSDFGSSNDSGLCIGVGHTNCFGAGARKSA